MSGGQTQSNGEKRVPLAKKHVPPPLETVSPLSSPEQKRPKTVTKETKVPGAADAGSGGGGGDRITEFGGLIYACRYMYVYIYTYTYIVCMCVCVCTCMCVCV